MINCKHILLFVVVLLAACTKNTTCSITNDIALQIGFYSDSIDTLGNNIIFAKAIDSITIQGVGNDSILYDNTKSVKTISLPLHNTQTTSQFAMTANGLNDTLIIRHQNNDIFVSLECGCFTYHTIDELTETAHLFDSIVYIDYEIGRTQTENIRLYWH